MRPYCLPLSLVNKQSRRLTPPPSNPIFSNHDIGFDDDGETNFNLRTIGGPFSFSVVDGCTSSIFWCFGSIEICTLQDIVSASGSTLVPSSRCRVCLHSGIFNTRKSFYACYCFQRAADTWILVTCWRSIHSSYLKPKYSLQMFIYYIFCNLVSCPCAC